MKGEEGLAEPLLRGTIASTEVRKTSKAAPELDQAGVAIAWQDYFAYTRMIPQEEKSACCTPEQSITKLAFVVR